VHVADRVDTGAGRHGRRSPVDLRPRGRVGDTALEEATQHPGSSLALALRASAREVAPRRRRRQRAAVAARRQAATNLAPTPRRPERAAARRFAEAPGLDYEVGQWARFQRGPAQPSGERNMARLARIGLLALLGGTIASPLALAQQPAPEPERNVTVEQRRRPQFDPLGIRAGGFLVFPQLSVGGEYDSNVFAAEDNEDDDYGLLIRPRITMNSQWSRHALNLSAFGEFALYDEFDENNYEDFGISSNGRLDITRNDTLLGELSLQRRHESRDAPEAVQTGDIVTYYEGLARLGYRRDFNLVFFVVGGSLTREDYQEEEENEDRRDIIEAKGDLRIGYKVSPRFNLFVQGDYTVVTYDKTPDNDGFDRDSKGYGFSVGSEIDITGILFGEVQVGYVTREYDDDDLDNVSGPGGRGRLTWNVTGLTSLIFEAGGGIVETTQAGASANLQSELSAEVQHELLRNLLLNGRLSYTRDDFDGIDRTDNTYRARAGVRYLLNRNLSIDGGYEFSTRDSDVDGADYDRHILRVGLTARL
jgi:hypothetical protein